jgi:hypothetical protein
MRCHHLILDGPFENIVGEIVELRAIQYHMNFICNASIYFESKSFSFSILSTSIIPTS